MSKIVDKEFVKFDYWEYRVEIICPNCGRKLLFNDQEQPFECECGRYFWVSSDVLMFDESN